MSANECCNGSPSCNVSKSIYTGKTDTGKGDKPRKVTKQYENNYTEIFPNAFKPKWQVELEKQEKSKSK
tara:strand:+ start:1717 stop:1923 length:207 start_codon:yes stop_codon:yes gene_type:complete